MSGFTSELRENAIKLLEKHVNAENETADRVMKSRVTVHEQAAPTAETREFLKQAIGRYIYKNIPQHLRDTPSIHPVVAVFSPTQYIVYLPNHYPAKDAIPFMQAIHATMTSYAKNNGAIHEGISLVSSRQSIFNSTNPANAEMIARELDKNLQPTNEPTALLRGCSATIQTTQMHDMVVADYVGEPEFNYMTKTASSQKDSQTIVDLINSGTFANYVMRTISNASEYAKAVDKLIFKSNPAIANASSTEKHVSFRNFPVTINDPSVISEMYEELWDAADPNHTKGYVALPHGFVNGNSIEIRKYVTDAIHADETKYGDFGKIWDTLCMPEYNSNIAVFASPDTHVVTAKADVPTHDEKLFRSDIHDLMPVNIGARGNDPLQAAHWTVSNQGIFTVSPKRASTVPQKFDYETLTEMWSDKIRDTWTAFDAAYVTDNARGIKHAIADKPDVTFLDENRHAVITLANEMSARDYAKLRVLKIK